MASLHEGSSLKLNCFYCFYTLNSRGMRIMIGAIPRMWREIAKVLFGELDQGAYQIAFIFRSEYRKSIGFKLILSRNFGKDWRDRKQKDRRKKRKEHESDMH